MPQQPKDVLARQIAAFTTVATMLNAAIDDITGATDPDTATWPDVTKYAHLFDAIQRSGLVENVKVAGT